MSFDPTKPADDSLAEASELRGQFNALKALNDGLPASTAMMDVLAAQTAGACPDVAELNLTISNPPTQAQVQAIADKLDELLGLLKRE